MLAPAGTRVDWFARTENRVPARMGTREHSFATPVDLANADALIAACLANGCPKGSNRSGLYEVQTDAGILSAWSADLHGHPRKLNSAVATFKSWEQLEADDAGLTGFRAPG